MYDESIEVCDDDEDDEYELLAGRRRPGVSPVRRPPFQQNNNLPLQRPSRSFQRSRHQLHRSESESLSLGMMSGDDDGSPGPPMPGPGPGPQGQGSEEQLQHKSGKKMSSKDFTPQNSQEGKHENLISMASSYAKKLMSSGSEKAKEKPPPDVAEATKREQKAPPEPRKPPPQQQALSPQQQQQPPPQSTSAQQHAPPPQQSRSRSEDDDDEDDEEDDEYDEMNMAQIEGLLKRVETAPYPSPGRFIPRPQPHTIVSSRPGNNHDRGGAGDPYSVREFQVVPPPPPQQAMNPYVQQPPHPHPSQNVPPQFHPGFGPATASLMSCHLSDDDSDLEVSISEGDSVDFSRMDKLMEMYTRSGPVGGGPMDQSLMMSMPTPEMASLGIVDDEIMENILIHRRMWEHQLDMKRDALRRRVLVMSDYMGVHAPGYDVYNPQEYEHLNVSPEIKELFHCITRYEPPMIGTQMDVKLKPFIPEYYPSVGDIDAFIKVLHPEVQDDHLGIKYLDEPSPFQSDPSVLDLRLRALAKQSSTKSVTVKKIDNVGKNAKIIENWIKDISDLHRSKPSPSVHYSKPMPDIDSLIQEWPAQVEDLLKTISLPSSELDCDLSTYVDIVSNLLDIPVYKSRIQSLHVLFTLYATYKHFNHYGPLGMGSAGGGSEGRTDLDHLLPSATSVRMEEGGDVDRLQINN